MEHARISARSVRLDLPALDRPRASSVNTIIPVSSMGASIIAGDGLVPGREKVGELAFEADEEQPCREDGQEDGRDVDHAGPGVAVLAFQVMIGDLAHLSNAY